jgi:hypothetical protein
VSVDPCENVLRIRNDDGSANELRSCNDYPCDGYRVFGDGIDLIVVRVFGVFAQHPDVVLRLRRAFTVADAAEHDAFRARPFARSSRFTRGCSVRGFVRFHRA